MIRTKSGSSKENMRDSETNHSQKERLPANYGESISNSSGKEYIHSRHGTSSGKEYINSVHSESSEKESYRSKVNDQSSGKEIYISQSQSQSSEKETYRDESSNGSDKEYIRIKNSSHTSSNKIVIEHHPSNKSSEGERRLNSLTSSNKENEIAVPDNTKDSNDSKKELIKITISDDENSSNMHSSKDRYNEKSISANEVELDSQGSTKELINKPIRVLVDRSVGSSHFDPPITSDGSAEDESSKEPEIHITTEQSIGSQKEDYIEISFGSDKESVKSRGSMTVIQESTPERDYGSSKDTIRIESKQESDLTNQIKLTSKDFITSDRDSSQKEYKMTTSSEGSQKEIYNEPEPSDDPNSSNGKIPFSYSNSSKENADIQSNGENSKETCSSKDVNIQISMKSDEDSCSDSDKEEALSGPDPHIIIEHKSLNSSKESVHEEASHNSTKEYEAPMSTERDNSSGKSNIQVQVDMSEPNQSQRDNHSIYYHDSLGTSEQEKFPVENDEFDYSSKDIGPIESKDKSSIKGSSKDIEILNRTESSQRSLSNIQITETDNGSRKEIIIEELSSEHSSKQVMTNNDLNTISSGKDIYSQSSKEKPTTSERYSAKEIIDQMSSSSLKISIEGAPSQNSQYREATSLGSEKEVFEESDVGSEKEVLEIIADEDEDIEHSDQRSSRDPEISIE